MKNLNRRTESINGKMTSLELASFAGKRHHHLLSDIRKMEKAWEEVTGTKFGFSIAKMSRSHDAVAHYRYLTEHLNELQDFYSLTSKSNQR